MSETSRYLHNAAINVRADSDADLINALASLGSRADHAAWRIRTNVKCELERRGLYTPPAE